MSEKTLEKFAQKFANELQVELDVALSAKLSEMPEYDSMAKITVSLLIEELFDFQIEYDDLNNAETLKDLYEICIKN